jgi:AcrR family transcriptional regulator
LLSFTGGGATTTDNRGAFVQFGTDDGRCPGSGVRLGVKTPRAKDRRVERTRRSLREALVALILEKGFEAVSVQDVIDRADVGRSTFYTHFADKEDLLLSGFDDLRRALRQWQSQAPSPPGPLGFIVGLCEHADGQRRLFRALVGKKSGQAVLVRFRQMLIDLIREDLTGLPGAHLEATVHYLAGGFMEMLTWWLDTRNTLSPAQFAGLIHELATPTLRRFGAR